MNHYYAWVKERDAEAMCRTLKESTAINPVSRRAAVLTPRERECLLWLASGLRNERIASRMQVSLATVEFHLSNIRRKLGASTREQALALAIVRGLIEP